MFLTEAEKKAAVLSASDLSEDGLFVMWVWVQSYSWNKDLLFYFLFEYDSYHLSIAFFNRSFNEGKIGIMKFRDDERNCAIYLWVNSSLQQQRYQKSEYVQLFFLYH